jgi:multiple sugar transport system ATP-binding protein
MANITLTNVWKIYNEGRADEVLAVKEVNLVCQDGEFLALLGPSGCGKTSTLRMIAGLETISRGEIRIGDRLVNALHPSERDIAMVFESYALYEHLNVYENIAFPLRVRGLSKDEIDRRVKRAADILDIGQVLQRMPAHLSDGQKQRVSIGRAIVREPAAFLMDEPISHLDAMLRSRMRLEITHLQRELGVTTVYVTHDQLEATAMADRIVVMHLGEVQQIAGPLEIFENPANLFVADFVGEPPMNFFDLEITAREPHPVLQRPGLTTTVDDPARVQALLALDQPRVTLGVRPMHIQAHTAPIDGAIPAQVYVVEPLDEFNIITTLVGGERVLVETSPDLVPDVDQTLWLTFAQDRLHLFHPVTGARLLA